jgi:hypothetical protein
MAKKINDLDPDGLRIIVPWEDMQVDSSFFVPCINVELCWKQAVEIANRLGISLRCKQRIEAQCLGLRIWRTA